MNIFGVGIPEILVVLLLAAVIFGPGRLPEFAAQFGRAIRELREYARDFRDEYLTDFEEMREEYIEVRHTLAETDQDIRRDLEEAEADIRAAARDAEAATEDAITTARDGGTPAAAAPTTTTVAAVEQAETPDRSATRAAAADRAPAQRPRGRSGRGAGAARQRDFAQPPPARRIAARAY